jgi:hypothetical protein
MIRWGVQLVLAMLLAIAILVNARLYGGTDADVAVSQLHFLRQALDRGAGEEMQGNFPEGYFFMHALYGAKRKGAILKCSRCPPTMRRVTAPLRA